MSISEMKPEDIYQCFMSYETAITLGQIRVSNVEQKIVPE